MKRTGGGGGEEEEEVGVGREKREITVASLPSQSRVSNPVPSALFIRPPSKSLGNGVMETEQARSSRERERARGEREGGRQRERERER